MHVKSISITIKSTDACNMRCKHCYHAEVGFNPNSLDINLAKQIINMASKDYNHINVLYMGGEPTLYGIDNFISFLDYQKKLEKELSISFSNTMPTNGISLKEDFISLFKENKFKISVSFDGPHNDDLRTDGDEVLKNIQNAKKMGLYTSLICVETSKSIKNLEYTYNWFKEIGFDFKFCLSFISGNAKDYMEFELDVKDYADNVIKLYETWIYDLNLQY